MPIFYIQYEAIPAPGSEHFETAGGAYVNCWVKVGAEREAQERTSNAIAESGWQILGVEELCREVTEDSYSDNDEGLDRYREAVVNAECYVFHVWPVEPTSPHFSVAL
jgi:hypothetical protein